MGNYTIFLALGLIGADELLPPREFLLPSGSPLLLLETILDSLLEDFVVAVLLVFALSVVSQEGSAFHNLENVLESVGTFVGDVSVLGVDVLELDFELESKWGLIDLIWLEDLSSLLEIG